jgi:hypothetical protein
MKSNMKTMDSKVKSGGAELKDAYTLEVKKK